MMKISLKKSAFLFSLLLPAGIYADSDVLNLNFNWSESPDRSLKTGIQADACRSLSDPLTLKLILDNVNSVKENITLKIDGKEIYRSAVPFKSGVNFAVPFRISHSSTVKENLVYLVKGRAILKTVLDKKTEPYCFVKTYSVPYGFEYTVYGGNTLGYTPVTPKNYPSTFRSYCLKKPESSIIFDYEKPVSFYDPIAYAIRNRAIDEVFLKYKFHKSATYKDVLDGYEPPREQTVMYSKPIAPVKNISSLDYRLPFSTVGYKAVSNRLNGEMEFQLSQRNIQHIELTVSSADKKKTSSFRWSRGDINNRKTMNILRLVRSGDMVKPAAGQSYTEDLYLRGGFYRTRPAGFYRGTLVASSGLSAKYNSNPAPLSPPASIEGDINLVNTDNITLMLKRDKAGNYTAWFYGQPLQFTDIITEEKKQITAKKVRDACY